MFRWLIGIFVGHIAGSYGIDGMLILKGRMSIAREYFFNAPFVIMPVLARETWHDRFRHRVDVAEYWLAYLLPLSLALWVTWRTGRKPIDPNCCAVCGYDLRASPERCPECGTPKSVGGRQ